VFPLAAEAKDWQGAKVANYRNRGMKSSFPPIISLKEFHFRLEQNEEGT
jgi:hypothetical protein